MPAKNSIIVAHDDKLGIGSTKISGLLWHIKADFLHFKNITLGHPIIMGRKTYESIGKPLPGRTNIVITRDPQYSAPGCEVVFGLEKAIEQANQKDDQEIFIIGGGEIFKQALAQDLVNRLYITHVQGDFQADIFFPAYPEFIRTVSQESGQEKEYKYTYHVFEKN